MDRKNKGKELRIRCWIEIDGEKFFGPGRVQLLELIKGSGSISKAAKEMGMSYKKAWAMVDDLNAKGQKPYVTTHKGGSSGGGAELTAHGEEVLALFKALDEKLQSVAKMEDRLLGMV